MPISVVIPTCDRKSRLLSLLDNLDHSTHPLLEIIVVDSGSDPLVPSDYAEYKNLNVRYMEAAQSVCVQRNTGIREAGADWIFLCDDDIEVPAGYLRQLMDHILLHPEAGAVSGLVLQKENNRWQGGYPLRSSMELLWKFIFQLSIWGEIDCGNRNVFIRRIKSYYRRKGNHISKAGWPVITDFSGDYFVSPVYGLGASLVKKEWLVFSPYDEVLDRHGIGDNYGVAMGFPAVGVHVLNNAVVYHHHEPANRLQQPLQYFRRVLALDYFIKTKRAPEPVTRRWLIWSLTGNFLATILWGDHIMLRSNFLAIRSTLFGWNPYYKAARSNDRIIEPMLTKNSLFLKNNRRP
jgi:glycosyltransferase involved in cell wall biosynthesis